MCIYKYRTQTALLSEISTPAQSLCSLATLFSVAVPTRNLVPSRLEAADEVPLKIWEGPCTHPHLNLSSMNGFHWFKGTKEEILAHLTHFDGTVAAHAYMSASATKALQEDHGQQWHGIAKAGVWQTPPTKKLVLLRTCNFA